MISSVPNIFKIPDLRKKILFTLAMVVVYRLGGHVPIPGINTAALAYILGQMRGTVFGLYDIFVGGALSRAAVLALGIMPYISASIIMQLLTVVIPSIEALKKGASGFLCTPFTDRELSEELGVSVDDVRVLTRASRSSLSLNEPVDDEGDSELGDLLEQTVLPDTDERILWESFTRALSDALAELPERRVPPRTEPPLRRIARTAG